jgi:radical SAM protein with 4Fe4S-binding SPASM domain
MTKQDQKISFSVGFGTTSRCNLRCAHCYSRIFKLHDLRLEDVKELFDKVNISSLNFGTGENGLNPHFCEIIDYAAQKKIKMGLTSNGYTVLKLTEEQLKYFHDIDISMEFANKRQLDAFRGPGVWDQVMQALEKSTSLGIPTSIVMTLMSINLDQIMPLLRIAENFDVSLRINIYKPVRSKKFSLSYDQFWHGIKILLDNAKLISCSEPVVNAMLGLPNVRGSPCGKSSVRIRPDGWVIPCVYWPSSDIKLSEFCKEPKVINQSLEFKSILILPTVCKNCEYLDICGGGCASRRRLEGKLNEPDPYCPVLQGDKKELSFEPPTGSVDYVHSSYLCTLILKP